MQILSEFCILGTVFFNLIEQLIDRYSKRVGDDFDGVKCRIGLTVLNPAEVSLIETALLAEHHLTHTRF